MAQLFQFSQTTRRQTACPPHEARPLGFNLSSCVVSHRSQRTPLFRGMDPPSFLSQQQRCPLCKSLSEVRT